MSRPFGLALLCVLPMALGAQVAVARGYSATSDVSIRVWVPAGKVRIETWDHDSIQVTGNTARNAHFVGFSGAGIAKLAIEGNDPKDTGIPRGDLVVTVPRKAHTWVKMTDGDVRAAHTAGELEIITVTGSIAAEDAQGVVSVETIDASVTLTRVTGAVRIHSGGGPVVLGQVHGTLTATTVSGTIDLAGLAMTDARLETIGGPIIVRGTVARGALLDLETHNGPIKLYLDRGAVPALNLTSRSGTVKNGLGLGFNGSGRIIARSFGGDINVVAATGIEGMRVTTPP